MILFLVQLAFGASDPSVSSEDLGVGEAPFLEIPNAQDAHERTERLAKRLRCPVCQGLSVSDSRSDAAVAMKKRIQGLVERGYSEEQVEDYFIERYGEWVLLKPKYEHWFVWIAPIVAGVAGLGFVLVHTARRKDEFSQDVDVEEQQQTVDESGDSYRAKVLQELED